ncbi:MAG: RIO1 family regulatory kinase/ATPase domain-containing protein [Candidatus Hodarchaeales archaeon]|jgi:RIO kinase 2
MKEQFANKFLSLNQHDFRILAGIERLMITQQYPRVQEIPKETGYSSKLIQKRLKKLHDLGLIEVKRKEEEYYETAVNFNGYDILAFNALVKKDIISGFGQKLGVGKESDVFFVQNDNHEIGVVKIHRLGKGSFRAYKRKRDYLAEKHHSSNIYNSRLAAHHEGNVLNKLQGVIPVPKIWGINRHCIVMEYIEGVELYTLRRLDPRYLHDLFEKIYNSICDLSKIGFIHGDLSPYNILVTYDAITDSYNPFIIDWPQAISTNHPNAKDTLFLDISNIFSFFSKRIPISNQPTENIVRDLLK